MRALRLLPLAVFLLIVAAGCGRNKPAPAPAAPATPPAAPVTAPAAAAAPADPRPVLLAFGDSLTAGLGVPADRNYPAQLQRLLDEKGHRYRVVEAGRSGETSRGGVDRVDSLLAAHQPAIVILELGANDGLRGLPVAQMKQNLGQMIEKIQKAGARVVLAGMEAPPNYGPVYTAQYRKAFADLAREYKAAFIPFFLEGVGGQTGLNQADGIHPTEDGYTIVTQHVYQVLEPLLK